MKKIKKKSARSASSRELNAVIPLSEELKHFSNSEDFINKFSSLTDATFGVVLVRSQETMRVIESLRLWSLRYNYKFLTHTPSNGVQIYPTMEEAAEAGPDDAIAYLPLDLGDGETLSTALEALPSVVAEGNSKTKKYSLTPDDKFVLTCVVHNDADLNNPYFIQILKNQVDAAISNSVRLVIVAPLNVSVPEPLKSDIRVLDFKLPSYKDLMAAAIAVVDKNFEQVSENVWCDAQSTDITPEEVKRETALREMLDHISLFPEDFEGFVSNGLGMTLYEFEMAISEAFIKIVDLQLPYVEGLSDYCITDDDVSNLIRDTIRQAKLEVIKNNQCLDILETGDMKEVGGMNALKHFLISRRNAFSDKAAEFGVEMPKGIVVLGPPGVGKSLVAKATSGMLGLSCVRFDFSSIFGSLVGESEERMRSTLQMVESMAPVVLFIDEIDKALGGTSGGGSSDGGTTLRVFGKFLTWLADRDHSSSPVFCVVTANNVDHIPPEMFRAGRWDTIFGVDFPTQEEREEIFDIHLKKRGKDVSKAVIKAVAAETSGYSGGEIEQIVKDSILFAFNKDESDITKDILIATARSMTPLSVSHSEQLAAMQENSIFKNAKKASSENKAAATKRVKPKGRLSSKARTVSLHN